MRAGDRLPGHTFPLVLNTANRDNRQPGMAMGKRKVENAPSYKSRKPRGRGTSDDRSTTSTGRRSSAHARGTAEMASTSPRVESEGAALGSLGSWRSGSGGAERSPAAGS